jgi:tetratricopeptide (TPR) repeat protein
MKKILLAMLLVAAVTAVAQTTPAPAQPAPAQGAAPTIKDPAEYNAYVGAIQQQDPAAKISGLEAFLTQYPNSVMKEDALQLLMSAYGQTGNVAKAQDTALKVLQANPCNLRALALLAFAKRAAADAGGAGAAQALTEAGQDGEKGLQCIQTAPKPEGSTDAEWQKLKTETAGIFNGAAGMAAYQAKDYVKAQQYLSAAVQADPPDASSLRDVYPLALAYLTPPICPPPAPAGDAGQAAAPATPAPAGCSDATKETAGLFYIARAAALAQGAGKAQIAKFGQSKYNKFHGGTDGWDDLMAKAATATSPAGITVTQYVPPTPAQQCADILKQKKVEEMNFAEWQLCLSEGNAPDADKVWTTLKGKPLQMVAHIISIDTTGKATRLMLAGSEDDIEAKRADIDLTMTAAIPKKDMPKDDTDFQFQGTPTSYTPKPFVMTMDDGAMLVKAAPKKPAPARRKPAAQ